MNADNGPANGPRMIPSIGSKYMAQLRHKGDGMKYNIACRDANTPIRVMVLEDKGVLNDIFSKVDRSILKTNVIFYTTINKFCALWLNYLLTSIFLLFPFWKFFSRIRRRMNFPLNTN